MIVNHSKSSNRKTDGLENVGYEFRNTGGQLRVSSKKLDAFKQRAKENFSGKRGVSMRTQLVEFYSYARGWLGYFGLAQVKSALMKLDTGFGNGFELVI
ncbi:hypothetical protein N9Y42_00065 [Mariniblastus sp.]|nr:hypothetical protein [Mariniblastus sp.]